MWDINNDLGQAYAGRARYPQKTGPFLSSSLWEYYPEPPAGLTKASDHAVLLPVGYSAAYNKFGGVRH